jgi:iron complex transport system permease protein
VSLAEAGGIALPDRAALGRRTGVALGLLVLVVAAASLSIGAASGSPMAILAALLRGEPIPMQDWIIVMEIRLPRLLLGLVVGASLAVSGAVMQGLFRNPLADPGLVGVSAGAGLGAITAIVLGGLLPVALADRIGFALVPLAAFAGGWASTMILYSVSTRAGRTSVATMLLAGIALGALAGAVSGVLVYMADDRQLRDLTFWGMGSLAGATWTKLAVAVPIMLAGLAVAPFLARGLNGLALGEAAAMHMGLPVQWTKRIAILSVAAATGAAVAVSGGIGFVGIVVPHLLRLFSGPDHTHLLPNSALLGGALLVMADIISRTVISPAELPIGIVTAVIGGPVFLWILLRRRGLVDL